MFRSSTGVAPVFDGFDEGGGDARFALRDGEGDGGYRDGDGENDGSGDSPYGVSEVKVVGNPAGTGAPASPDPPPTSPHPAPTTSARTAPAHVSPRFIGAPPDSRTAIAR